MSDEKYGELTYLITDNNWQTIRLKHGVDMELYAIEIVIRELDTVRDVTIYLTPLEMANIIRAVEGKIVPLEKR